MSEVDAEHYMRDEKNRNGHTRELACKLKNRRLRLLFCIRVLSLDKT